MKFVLRLAGSPFALGTIAFLLLFFSFKTSVSVENWSIDLGRTSLSVPLISVHKVILNQEKSDLFEFGIIVIGTAMLILHLGRARS